MANNSSFFDQTAAAEKSVMSTDSYVDGILAGDRSVLSRAITLVESRKEADQEKARAILNACMPHTGNSLRVGITGIPGVGKSTFIEALGSRLLGGEGGGNPSAPAKIEEGNRDNDAERAPIEQHTLAVLAVDPSSERSQGSILGDKTRMAQLAQHAQAYIRPSPTGGTPGGVARRTREAILLCEAAGFDLIFVETVGVGQAETTVRSMVDVFLLLALAGAGDELQGVKRGVMEMADIIAITKSDEADRQSVEQAAADYERALRLLPSGPSAWDRPVLSCSAVTGDGMDELWHAVTGYHRQTTTSGYFEEQRRQQARRWMQQTIEDRLMQHFYRDPEVRERMAALEEQVVSGHTSAVAAAEELLAEYFNS